MSIIGIILLAIGVVAVYKWFRKSFKKHTFLWVLGIIAVIALVIFL